MADVLNFTGLTYAKDDPVAILEKAKGWDMERCVIIGYGEKENLRFGGSFCEAGEILMLLELAKKFIIENHFAREP